jgi:UDP-glucose 4-epimerase
MILVTGAAGFIGSAIAKSLNNEGIQTLTIDDLSTGYKKNIPDGTVFIEGDCGSPEVISQLDKYKIDAILHFAGQSSGEVSFSNPLVDQKSNTTSSLLLLKYAKEKGIKRFVYASSMSVYGEHEDLPVTEQSETRPKSFYAVGKLASEHYLRIYSSPELETVALRLFNVYGPGQNLANLKQGMLSIYLAQALNDGEIIVKGSMERFRDLVYVDDVVDITKLLLSARLTSSFSVFNVSNGYPVKVHEMISALTAGSDSDLPVTEIGFTPGDQFGIFGSNYKLLRDFGWWPKTGHVEGINKMLTWAESQKK